MPENFNPNQIAFIWLVFGIVLTLLELILPGLVVVFLGLGAILVGLAVWFGWIESFMSMFVAWFILSIVLVLGLRQFFARFADGESSVDSLDEDGDAFGETVRVIETIAAGAEGGRIEFRGSSWPAYCADFTIEKGSFAKILVRDNARWIVEPTGATENQAEDP